VLRVIPRHRVFFSSAAGQLVLGLDYVPLPEAAIQSIEASWKGIQGSGM